MENFIAKELRRGSTISLQTESGNPVNEISIGSTWGAAKESTLWGLISYQKDIDLDLSCVMFNKNGKLVDHIYSPLFREDVLKQFGLPKGKYISADGAIVHSGDDINGDSGPEGEDTDNELITIKLDKISPGIEEIYIFLNNCGEEDFKEIPYAKIRIYEGNPANSGEELAYFQLDTDTDFYDSFAIIMGKLSRNNNGIWQFQAIGDPTNDPFPGYTIHRIASDYASK